MFFDWHYLDGIKSGKRVSAPESRQPPTRPERKQVQPTDNSYIVKVRYTFNFAVCVAPGCPYDILIGKISKKLNFSSASITLRYGAHLKNTWYIVLLAEY